jgi:hypothetical protein
VNSAVVRINKYHPGTVTGVVVGVQFLSIFTTTMAWMLVSLVVGLFAHEAGHCAAAALAALPIRRVRIGMGRLVAQAWLGKTELELCMVPLRGFVLAEITRLTPRPRLAVFLLGGLAVNAVLFGITFWLWRHSRVLDLSEDPLFGFWYAQLMLFVGTLIPLWTRLSGTRIANDGMQLLLLSRGRHSI